jgi:phospholipid transport system transporter-binding protein
VITLDAANNGRAALAGPVTLATVNAVLDEGNRVFKAAKLEVDLSGVTDLDSTAVSVLLEWRRAALRDKREIAYVNYPENLKSLIKLYGISELLAVS